MIIRHIPAMNQRLKVARFHDGASLFELLFATYDNDASINQGANLALWAEAAWFPAIWLTDGRVRWQAMDDHTALMFVPFRNKEEDFVLRFNPETGLLDSMEAMRYRDAGDQARKILWITRAEPGPTIAGTPLSAVGAAIWLDQGRPWAVFTLEDVVYNADVSTYIRQRVPMKKTLFRLLLAALLLLVTAMPALAGGDQMRGENGQGAVNQVQVQNPPPFQP